MNAGFINEAQLSVVDIGTCDVKRGGCGGLVVVDVQEVIVTLRTRRVEGEGAAEDGGAMPVVEPVPVAEHRPLQVETDNTPTLAELPDEVVEQLADVAAASFVPAISAEAKAVLGPENVVLEPLHTNGHGPIKFKWTGFDHEVGRLQAGRDFVMLPKSTRRQLVDVCGRQIAAHVHEPPSRKQWNDLKPSWMTTANSVEVTYMVGYGWSEKAIEWHLHAKGLAK